MAVRVATTRRAPGSERWLPHAVIATTFVVVLPAVLVSLLVPAGSLALLALSLLLGVALSLAAASVGGAIWSRLPGSQDRVFADLMLWGWLRRSIAERRLAQAEKLLGTDPQGASLEALIDLSELLEARDARTYGHSQRVTRHAERIATAMGLPAAEVAKVRTAAALHDIGKLHTPRDHPQQARAPDRQRVRADQAPPGRRRGDDERHRRPRDLRDDPPPPRAARRARLPGRAVGRGHPASARASSPSPTRSTRSPPTARTGAPRTTSARSTCSRPRPASSSTATPWRRSAATTAAIAPSRCRRWSPPRRSGC